MSLFNRIKGLFGQNSGQPTWLQGVLNNFGTQLGGSLGNILTQRVFGNNESTYEAVRSQNRANFDDRQRSREESLADQRFINTNRDVFGRFAARTKAQFDSEHMLGTFGQRANELRATNQINNQAAYKRQQLLYPGATVQELLGAPSPGGNQPQQQTTIGNAPQIQQQQAAAQNAGNQRDIARMQAEAQVMSSKIAADAQVEAAKTQPASKTSVDESMVDRLTELVEQIRLQNESFYLSLFSGMSPDQVALMLDFAKRGVPVDDMLADPSMEGVSASAVSELYDAARDVESYANTEMSGIVGFLSRATGVDRETISQVGITAVMFGGAARGGMSFLQQLRRLKSTPAVQDRLDKIIRLFSESKSSPGRSRRRSRRKE